MRFRKRPVVIDAIQFTGTNDLAVIAFADEIGDVGRVRSSVAVETNGEDIAERVTLLVDTTGHGEARAEPGDWIIRGVQGELYPCKPDVFAATYESVP